MKKLFLFNFLILFFLALFINFDTISSANEQIVPNTKCIKHERGGKVACGGLAIKCIKHERSGNVACSIDNYWHRYVNTVLKESD